MSFRLEWRPAVLKRFTAEWEQLPKTQRQRVMDALDSMDQLLTERPMQVGESRSMETLRIHFIPPISVFYRVNLRLQLVEIVGASIFRHEGE